MPKFVNAARSASKYYIASSRAAPKMKSVFIKPQISNSAALMTAANRLMATFVSQSMDHYNPKDFATNQAQESGSFAPTVSSPDNGELNTPGHSQN